MKVVDKSLLFIGFGFHSVTCLLIHASECDPSMLSSIHFVSDSYRFMVVLPTVLAAFHAVKRLAIGVTAGFLCAHKNHLLATLAVAEELYLGELEVFV